MKYLQTLFMFILWLTPAHAGAQVDPNPVLVQYADNGVVWADGPTQAPYGSPQWRDDSVPKDGDANDQGEWHFPVAYKVGQKIKIGRIEFCDAAPEEPSTLMDVLGYGPDGHQYFASAFVDPVSGNVVATAMQCDQQLPMIRFYNPYVIT